MFKLGKDIEVKPIKLENKYSTKELNDIYTKVNELLYFYSTLYITEKAKQYIIKRIVELGNELKDIVWPMSKGKRREELRNKMGVIYKALVQYNPNEDKDRKYTIEYNMNKYLTSRFLYDKQNEMTEEIAFKWIKTIRQFAQTNRVDNNLISVQNECLEYLRINKTLE